MSFEEFFREKAFSLAEANKKLEEEKILLEKENQKLKEQLSFLKAAEKTGEVW